MSEEVALLMAQGAQKKFGSSWAISTTGYSGPTGGSPAAPLGTLCVGVVGPHKTQSYKYVLKNLSRTEHQERSCEIALKLFLKIS